MSYDGRLLRLAQERYEADRSIREAEQAARREAIYTSRPRLREIDEELRRTASRVLAAALRRGQDPLPEIQRLKEQNLSLQEERKGLLAELGLTETALEETPLCPLCGDTGYRGGEICRCLKVYYVEEQRKELSKLLDLGGQSFDTFDTDWYSDQRAPGKSKSAREHMERVYDTCVEYAHNFGKRPANLLLFGRPGLGKTHLSAAIAREVSGKGFSVVYDTAGHVFERFEAQKFGRDEAERDVERVLNCDLLILDDLGTELTTAFVQSALYQILNSRLLEKRSTIVSTNLMPEAIGQRYSPQIASRIEGEYQLLPFVGEDIRTLKKKRGL
ncbi:MAG: ATP-binding protein [Oscillibacter sp.]|jgi:DNA replication protein DnaC|uniref:ATP-binding protein n=1 Tax=uncultured Dysosmobacter sp. TaxID=2591384 RepID=UPI0025D25EB1|nr:ATP-binding protein [Dysosmobacter sp.]MDD6409839.1 ATP-binding protein [Oscillibacter sp.]MDY3866915.1 ATP-binding protein [Dysosmobacter sp.]